jgi:hypothetical protein
MVNRVSSIRMNKIGASLFVICCLASSVAAQKKEAVNPSDVSALLIEFNSLPRTETIGLEGHYFQSAFEMEFKRNKRLLRIHDTRFRGSSEERTPVYMRYDLYVDSLHPMGFHVERISRDTVGLRIITAANRPNIRRTVYVQGRREYSVWLSELSLSIWADAQLSKLEKLQSAFSSLVGNCTDWGENTLPDPDLGSWFVPDWVRPGSSRVFLEQNPHDPTLLNESLECPALFDGASDYEQSYKLLEQFVLTELGADSLLVTGYVFCSVTIGKDGRVEEYRSYHKNTTVVEEKFKEILVDMPEWSPAEFRGKPVRVIQDFLYQR